MEKIKTTACFLLITFAASIFVSSCRTNKAATDSANLFDKNASTTPTKQPTASPTSEQNIVGLGEKKLRESFTDKIPPFGQTLEDFIPADGSLVQKATGDLNGDGRADGAMIVLDKVSEVFELEGKITSANQYKQYLVIVLQNPDGKFKLQTFADHAFFPLNSDKSESSAAEVKIKNGELFTRDSGVK